MSSNDLLQVLQRIAHPNVLVLGDLILDRYTLGNAERISQEAPVIVLRADRRETRLGGAANVANMLATLEARVTAAGVVGCDAAGNELRDLLVAAGVDCASVLEDPLRPTSVKERFVGRASSRHPNQILRVDHECSSPLAAELEEQMIELVVAQVPRHDAILVPDYGKGVCTPLLLATMIAAARRHGVPVLVDPARNCPLQNYRGVTAIKPNRLEAELAWGRKIVSATDALAAGRHLCQDLDAAMALITLDRDGMVLVDREGHGEGFPTQARAVYDITGAGDMVMAMIGLCLAADTRPADAVRLANVAAGLEVDRAGVAVISRDEIKAELLSGRGTQTGKIVNRDQAALLAEEHRHRGQTVVLTNGCYDLLHVGHVTYLAEAASLGDVLIVAVNSDASVRRLKGSTRPIIGETDRAAMLAAMACVDHVIVFDEDTPHALLEAIRPDVLVKGGTYSPSEVVGHEIVEAYGGRVCVTGVVDGISTTGILASLARGDAKTVENPPSEELPSRGLGESAARFRRAG